MKPFKIEKENKVYRIIDSWDENENTGRKGERKFLAVEQNSRKMLIITLEELTNLYRYDYYNE
jgi:hypothetical protein